MIASALNFLTTHRQQAAWFGGIGGGALLLGGLAAFIPFLRPVEIEQASAQWDVPQLEAFDPALLSDALAMDGKWVVDPRTIRQRERQAREGQLAEARVQQPTDWTLLGVVGEGVDRYAVILLAESKVLLYSALGDDLPSGETITTLTETSMSVRSADGEKEYRLFVRN